MENRFYFLDMNWLCLIFFVSIMAGCNSEMTKESTGEGWGSCPLDSIEMSRKEVPSWDDTGHYSKVTLGIGLTNGNYSVTKDDTVVVSGQITDNVRDDLNTMLKRIKTTDLEKIYNVKAVEEVELELYFFCDNYARSHMVKSFGQHGGNPSEIKEAYSYLLRFTKRELQNAD